MPSTPAINKVIKGEFCIGCGACGVIDRSLEVVRTDNGENRVICLPDRSLADRASNVCPMGSAPDEDALAARFLSAADNEAPRVGRYTDLFAGYSEAFRKVAGSGGVTRWMIASLLRAGEVGYVVSVERKATGADAEDLFFYTMHSDADAYLESTSSSAYYPVTLRDMFDKIESLDGRCIVTALPCFARAIRAVSVERPDLGAKIRYVSGVVCGGLKSQRYADYMALQLGAKPERVDTLNFRGKSLSRTANEKCVEVTTIDNPAGEPLVARVQQLRGTDYGIGYFKPKGCDYCDDVLAETADISFGDAWIEPYRLRPQGTNLIVVRNPELSALLKRGVEAGDLVLDPLTPDQVVTTQASGFRHRRDGLQLRLWLARKLGYWAPRKRVAPLMRLPLLPVQLARMAIRRVTGATWLPLESRAFGPVTLFVEKFAKQAQRLTKFAR